MRKGAEVKGKQAKKISTGFCVSMIVITAFAFITVTTPHRVIADTLYVGGAGPGNYTNIQDAVNASKPGDTIYVYSGIYFENVHINKTVNLIGENNLTTIIDGNKSGHVVHITNVNYLNMSGFSLRNSTENLFPYSGVYINSSSDINISNNIIHDNHLGISIVSSSFLRIQGNEIYDNFLFGTYSWHSSNNNFIGNTIHDHIEWLNSAGMFFSGVPYYNNKIAGNIVYDNDRGIHLETQGFIQSTFWNNWIINNTVYNYEGIGISMTGAFNNYIIGNTVYNTTTVPINPEGGIQLSSCNDTIIKGNTVHKSQNGIYLQQSIGGVPSRNNTIKDNTIYNNENGIRLSRTRNNTFIDNVIFNNNISVGMYNPWWISSYGGIGNNFINCTLANASINIYMNQSSDNSFINCSLSNAITNVYAEQQSRNNNFINSSLSNAGNHDFNLTDDSHAILLNTTFDKSKVTYGDTLSTLTVKWFMHVKVIYNSGTPVDSAFVEVFDISGTPKASRVTNSDGRTKWIVLTEYLEQDVNGDTVGERTYYTEHNATATDGIRVGYAIPEPFMDKSKEVVIVLFIWLPDYIPWNPSTSVQKISVGNSVLISSRVKNIGTVNAINWATIAFYNQSMLPFKTYTVPPLIVGAATGDYSTTWTAPMMAGTYHVVIEVDYYNDIDEIDEANNIHIIEFNVTDKPITTINLGSPQYGTTPRFVNSSTQIWFSVVDNSGTGYSTHYYIDNPPWILHSGAFTVPTEGQHTINYYSVDNLNGVEDAKAFEIIVDNTPPTTNINAGDPKHVSGNTWVTSATEFTISVSDAGLIPVGVNHTEYRIWNGGSWTPWSTYTTGFSLGSSEGFSYVEFYSVDWLGNKELVNNGTYIVDNTAPTTTTQVGIPTYFNVDTWVTSNTGFLLNAEDGGVIQVGLNYTEYRIWYGTWSTWKVDQGEFTLDSGDGIRYLEYRSVDLLGNVETVSNETFIVDDTPPNTTITVSVPKFISDNIWITSDTEFNLSALDGGLIPVGMDYTEYRIWNNGLWSMWIEYSSGFTLDVDDGLTYVEFYSVDYLGNREITNNETYFIDNTPPVTTHILQLESDNTEARISLIANDVGSGVNYTKYRVDSGDWVVYSGTFIVNESGWHTIYFWSIDMLGNVEIEKSYSVFIEEPGTVIPPGDGENEFNWKPLIALIFTIVLLLVGTYISHKRPLKFIKNPKRKQFYTWMIAVLPFVVAEIATGIISYLTGLLSIPPFFGPGMVVDLAILILGLFIYILIYKKLGEK